LLAGGKFTIREGRKARRGEGLFFVEADEKKRKETPGEDSCRTINDVAVASANRIKE